MNNIIISSDGSEIKRFSVADMLKRYKNTESTKKIAEAIERYCTAANAYFNNRYVNPVPNISYDDVITEIGSHDIKMGEGYYGSSLLLKSSMILRHYYKNEVEGSFAKDDYFCVDKEIPANQYSDAEKFCVNDYISKVLSNSESDDNLKNLCVAIYNYGKAADEYAKGDEK